MPRQYISFRCAFAAAIAATLVMGCARPYLDPATKQIPHAEFRHVGQPKPVHLVFEFQTKGAPNSRATAMLTDLVKQEVIDSGLFGNIDAPTGAGTAMLNITLNNVPITSQSDAASKGFTTGLTFGLVGTSVTDGYICTVSYLASDMKVPIVKTARHAIHTTIGNASPPPDAIPAENMKEAAKTMTRQILSNALRELSLDSQF